ncbi:MAG: hypothetical protein WBO23_13160 [Burkholderiales bacterium]
MLDAIAPEVDGVRTPDEYKAWTRRTVRPLFPHKVLTSDYGAGARDEDHMKELIAAGDASERGNGARVPWTGPGAIARVVRAIESAIRRNER